MSQFIMPSLGADMESAVLMQWNVKVGDIVKKGQVIAEVETSKGVIEIEVFQNGIVEELLVEEETECKVGTPLALISDMQEATVKKSDEDIKKEEPNLETAIKKEIIIEKPSTETKGDNRIKASPLARKKAKELGVDLATISIGDNNPIHLNDIESKPIDAQLPKKILKEEKIDKKDSMRDAIAKAMSLSNKEIPHYYLSTTINITPTLKWLEELNKNRSISKRVLPAAVLIKACVKALEEVPQLNGFWIDNQHQISQEINPGIAIALRKGGLITPALLNASTLSLDETMEKFGDLIKRTRAGKLKGSELSKQTITITNLGDLGVEEVFGVIYPPQVAIIGLGKIHESPWAIDDTITVRKVFKATIAGDHRATDGRIGAAFLDKLDNILQNPKELL